MMWNSPLIYCQEHGIRFIFAGGNPLTWEVVYLVFTVQYEQTYVHTHAREQYWTIITIISDINLLIPLDYMYQYKQMEIS